MALVLFDSNILIDHTLGYEEATAEMCAYDTALISVITWIEVSCKLSNQMRAELDLQLLLTRIYVVHTDDTIMRRTADLRASTSKKLPDCIIRATAESRGCVIVTRNPIDFGLVGGPQVHVPYDLRDGVVSNVRPPVT